MYVPPSGQALVDVSVDITVQCIDDHGTKHDIDTVLGYRSTDPFAVTMTFLTEDGDLTWTFARDLLAIGVSRPVGDGDVRVSPALSADGRATIDIELTSPDGRLVLHASAEQVRTFISRSHALVASGAESTHIDMDAMITQLLGA